MKDLLVSMVTVATISGCHAGTDGPRPIYPGPTLEWEIKLEAASTLEGESTINIREFELTRERQPISVVPRGRGLFLVVFGNPHKLVQLQWNGPNSFKSAPILADIATTLVRPHGRRLFALTERGVVVIEEDWKHSRLIPLFEGVTDFAPVDDNSIVISPLFSATGPAIKVLDSNGIQIASWTSSSPALGAVTSPLRGAASVTACADKIVIAAEHEPLVAILERDLSDAIEVHFDVPSTVDLLRLANNPKATSPATGVSWLPYFTAGVACHDGHAFVLVALPRPMLMELDMRGTILRRYIGPPEKLYRRLLRLVASPDGRFYAIGLSTDESAYLLEFRVDAIGSVNRQESE